MRDVRKIWKIDGNLIGFEKYVIYDVIILTVHSERLISYFTSDIDFPFFSFFDKNKNSHAITEAFYKPRISI